MHRRAWLLIPSLVLLAACGNNDNHSSVVVAATPTRSPSPSPSPTDTATAIPTSTPTLTPLPVGAVALFNLDPLSPANPFPSDRLRDESGHVAVSGALIGADLPSDARYNGARSLANLTAEQLRTLTGFSTYAPIRIKFDAAVAAPADGSDAVLVLPYDDLEHPVAVHLRAVFQGISGDVALEIYPVQPLHPKTRYVYIVTRGLPDAAGDSLQPSPELTSALAGTSAWRTTLTPVLAHLSSARGIAPHDIVAIDFFTTQATTDDLVAIRDLLDGGTLPPADPVFTDSPIPGLTTGIFAEGTPEFADLIGTATSANVAAVAIGSFDSYDFRPAPQQPFDPARIAGAVPPRINHLDFYMTIPKAPPPVGGYPITIFGHGLGGNGRNAVFVSRLIGDAPMVAIGISAVEHGRRGTVANFFNLVNGFATREHFRQSVADFMQLARMIRRATVAPFDQVNKDRIEYMGVSLGGIMGTLFMGVEPLVPVGVLSVPGGGLPNILQSEAIGNLLRPLISLTVGIAQDDPNFDAFLYRYIHLAQWVLDAGDPINTAPYIFGPALQLPGVPAKRILMQEGVVDSVVPNATTDALALAMGLPDAKASGGCAASAGCTGIWRFVMTEYGEEELSGHSVTGSVPQAGAQAARFLTSNGEEIIDAAP